MKGLRMLKSEPTMCDTALVEAVKDWVTKNSIDIVSHYSKSNAILLCAGLRQFGVSGKDVVLSGLFGNKHRTYSVYTPSRNMSNEPFLKHLQEWDWKDKHKSEWER